MSEIRSVIGGGGASEDTTKVASKAILRQYSDYVICLVRMKANDLTGVRIILKSLLLSQVFNYCAQLSP